MRKSSVRISDIFDSIINPKEYKDAGKQGERFTYNRLRSLFKKDRLFRNVYLTKSDGTTTEIDLLALDAKGIYVIESKNYSGWIFGSDTERYWTAVLPNKEKHRFYSPISQNSGHIDVLCKHLNSAYPQLKLFHS